MQRQFANLGSESGFVDVLVVVDTCEIGGNVDEDGNRGLGRPAPCWHLRSVAGAGTVGPRLLHPDRARTALRGASRRAGLRLGDARTLRRSAPRVGKHPRADGSRVEPARTLPDGRKVARGTPAGRARPLPLSGTSPPDLC